VPPSSTRGLALVGSSPSARDQPVSRRALGAARPVRLFKSLFVKDGQNQLTQPKTARPGANSGRAVPFFLLRSFAIMQIPARHELTC
jgi:hypothetical protein